MIINNNDNNNNNVNDNDNYNYDYNVDDSDNDSGSDSDNNNNERDNENENDNCNSNDNGNNNDDNNINDNELSCFPQDGNIPMRTSILKDCRPMRVLVRLASASSLVYRLCRWKPIGIMNVITRCCVMVTGSFLPNEDLAILCQHRNSTTTQRQTFAVY